MKFAIRSLVISIAFATASFSASPLFIADALAAAPVISNERVQLRTLANGEVVVNVSATIEDLDGLNGIRVTVERPGVFGPFPMQPGLYTSPGDICTPSAIIPLACTLDGYNITIGPEFIPAALRAGVYLITAADAGGGAPVSTTVALPSGLFALPAGAEINNITVDTSTGLLRPTISIPAIAGATGYRITIQNDTDSTTTTFDGVSGADLSSSPSIRVGANLLEAGKFYRLSVDAFDGLTVASSNLRTESADICYDPFKGKTDIPCVTQKDVHLITQPDGLVVMQAIGRVLVKTEAELQYLKNPPVTDPPTVPVTVKRGEFGPFRLTASILENVDTDTDVTDQFTSARNPLDSTQIPVEQRAGDYAFRAQDSNVDVVMVTRQFPAGLLPLPAPGPVDININTASELLTPTVSISPVPGASNYRVVVFNDTDSTRINFDDLPGGTLAERSTVKLFPGVLEANKLYRIHMDAFNGQTFSSSTVRSRSNSLVYDPSGLDSDGDGIQDTIDARFDPKDGSFVEDERTKESNDFTNKHRGGNEFGTIADSGGLDVVVVESSIPQSDKPGLRLGAASDPTVVNGSGVALIEACREKNENGDDKLSTTQISLTERDAKILKCGSLISEILDGTVEFLLGADRVVIAPAGASLTIREDVPGHYSVEISPESLVPVTLLLKGEEITIQPGTPAVSLIDAKIEIRPLFPNFIHLGSKLPMSVAVLSSSNFSPDQEINRSTLTFGRTGLEAKSKGCLALDLNRDRKKDLWCAFSVQEAGFQPGDTVGVLKARTFAGQLVQGTDRVKILSGFKK